MLRHRPKALSAAGILPEGCLMALYVLENQSFPPAPLLRIAPFRVTSRPSAEPSFSNLPWVPACTPVFAQPSFPLLSCCCQRIHIQAAASFFHSHTWARWLQQLSYFIIAFVTKNEFFYFIITQILIIHSRHFFITSDLLCCLSVVALLYTLKFNICCIFWVCTITPLPVLSPPVYIFRIYFKMLKALQASSIKVCFFCVCCFLPNGKFLTLVVYSAELCGMLIWGWRHFLKQI